MNQQTIADLSAELIMQYYENDYMPFLNHMDDEALWYGPAEGQFLQGREEMIRVWNAEDHSLKFSLGNIEVTHITSNPSFCDVMLGYHVTTHYPDHHDITWRDRGRRIRFNTCQAVWQTVFALSSQPLGKPCLYPKHPPLQGHALRRNRTANPRKEIYRLSRAVSEEIRE